MSIFPFFSVIVTVKVRLHILHPDWLIQQTVTKKLQTPGAEQTPGKEPRRHGDRPLGCSRVCGGQETVHPSFTSRWELGQKQAGG